MISGSVEDLSVSRWSVVGESVEHLSTGRWLAAAGQWVVGALVSGSIVGCRWLVGRWSSCR